ncbi:MAG: 3-methyl-2-oxobutanoate dehydrogenase subunit beta, partial [Dehalococcoidia bacterium]
MGEKQLIDGSKAIAGSAIRAGCRFYASYPIQPNTHLIDVMANELAKVGGVAMNAESEGEAINMVWGAAATGNRAMCSTTVTGMSLMQEAMSEMFAAEIPYVFVHMARGQTEYRLGTRGGGHGEYRYIAFAPHTVQEAADLTRLAFYTADKYRTPVLVQADYVLTHTVEAMEFRDLDESDLEDKDWSIDGARNRPRRVNSFIRGTYSVGDKLAIGYGELQERSMERIAYLEENVPAMAETGHLDDADLVV